LSVRAVLPDWASTSHCAWCLILKYFVYFVTATADDN